MTLFERVAQGWASAAWAGMHWSGRRPWMGKCAVQGRTNVAGAWQGLLHAILLHFLHLWRSDVQKRPS